MRPVSRLMSASSTHWTQPGKSGNADRAGDDDDDTASEAGSHDLSAPSSSSLAAPGTPDSRTHDNHGTPHQVSTSRDPVGADSSRRHLWLHGHAPLHALPPLASRSWNQLNDTRRLCTSASMPSVVIGHEIAFCRSEDALLCSTRGKFVADADFEPPCLEVCCGSYARPTPLP